MTALSRGDAERLLRFTADAESVGGDEPFTPELLVELGCLIEADWVSYHETDYVHRRVLAFVGRPGDDDDEEEDGDITDDAWELMN